MPQSSPLYAQIARHLHDRLAELPVGARMASEPELARRWSVSRFTVARAVESLVDQGLLVRRRGAGTFKAEPPLRRLPGHLLSFTEAVAAAGHASSQRLLAFEPAGAAEGPPFRAGEPLFKLERLRLVDGIAAACHVSLLPGRIIERVGLDRDVAGAEGFSLYALFERHGCAVQNANERLIARAASGSESELLGLEDRAVVIAVTRHSFADDGSVVDAVEAIYDARRYSYEAHLTRSPDGAARRRSSSQESTYASDGTGWRDIGPGLGPRPDPRESRARR